MPDDNKDQNSTSLEGKEQDEIPEGAVLAAIDLGSNSFHLIIAKVEHSEVRPVETLSEKVQLGAGLKDGRLDDDSIQRGLDCLSRFKQVLDNPQAGRDRQVVPIGRGHGG